MTLESRVRSLTTAAEVSSQEDSIPRITVPMTTFYIFTVFEITESVKVLKR
jgi:hypothetical protein